VSRSVHVPFEYLDWSNLSPEQQATQIGACLSAERQRGFDLNCAPLMRISVIQQAENLHTFIWNHHHILLDGWCASIVLDQVQTLYEGYRNDKNIDLGRTRPYRAYIEWLQQQDKKTAEIFWRSTLAGFRATTPLPFRGKSVGTGNSVGLQGEESLWLSKEITQKLQELGRAHQVTVNTVVQGAWSLLLSRLSGETDLVFGSTVSGRPAELEGVEEMVGLFINALPVRVSVPPRMDLMEWLKGIQAQ